MLGIIINITKALDSRSIPSSLSMNLGRNDKKTKRLQLLEKVAATIAKNGLLRSKSLMGIFFYWFFLLGRVGRTTIKIILFEGGLDVQK